MYEPLKTQIGTTISRLERGEIQYADRVFLNHILEELEQAIDVVIARPESSFDISEAFLEMIGSTNELIEDGLDD